MYKSCMEREKRPVGSEPQVTSHSVKVYREVGRGMLDFRQVMPTDEFNELVAWSLDQRRNNPPERDLVRRQILNRFNERLQTAAKEGSPFFSYEVACFDHELVVYKEAMDDLAGMLNSTDKNYQARLTLEAIRASQQDINRWGEMPSRLLRLSVAAGLSGQPSGSY